MVLVGVVAVVASLLGEVEIEEPPPPPTPQVAFRTSTKAFADSGKLGGADTVARKRVRAEADAIAALLNSWYQRTFVDPVVFEVIIDPEEAEEAMFPPADLIGLFGDEAQASVAADLDVLTLGAQRVTFARIVPTRARADLTFFFEGAKKPSLAVADVTFRATGGLKDEEAFPVEISQHALFHFERAGDAWRIVFYEAEQQQESQLPPPSPTGSASPEATTS